MEKAYSRINWENQPSTKTALGASNLNRVDKALDEIDNRTITLDETKATKTEVSSLFSEVAFDESTGVITFTRKNGSTIQIDTKLEKLAVNFKYDPVAEKLVITNDDGSTQEVDLSALVTIYEFLDSDTIAFSIEDGKVKAIVKEGSISEKHLRPEYLADIKVESSNAAASATEAAERALLSKSYSGGGTGTREGEETDNSKYYSEQAKNYMEAAQQVSQLTVPQFYIDFSTGCLMSQTEAAGMEFEIVDGDFIGRTVTA